MDRRDFLKLFALGAAGLYIPKVTYFDMGKSLTSVYCGNQDFYSPLSIDGGYLIPVELHQTLINYFEAQKQVSMLFKVPQKLLGEVGSKTWLEELRQVEKSRGIK